jgi:multidrug efflux pump subunit AcrB
VGFNPRPRASDLGVRVSDIAGAVRLLMSGEDQISTFKEGSEQYPVTMRLWPGQRDNPAALSRLLVPSARLGLIRLDSVAKLDRGMGPSRIDRFNRQFSVGHLWQRRSRTFSWRGGRHHAAHHGWTGNAARLHFAIFGSGQDSGKDDSNMILAFGLASIFMYMVLAAQLESLVHPFIILLTLPLSLPFALISLIATGRSLNLFSALSVLLLGMVKKNGILQIDYMNRLRNDGMGTAPRHPRGESRALAADSDDDVLHCGRADPDGGRHRRGCVATIGDRGNDHRRTDVVSVAEAAGGTGRVFADSEREGGPDAARPGGASGGGPASGD